MPNRAGRDKQQERIQAIQDLRARGIYPNQTERRRINALLNRGFTIEDAYARTIARGAGSYTVRSGDTYFSIAQRVYGDARFAEQVARQFQAAKIYNLQPGQEVQLEGLNVTAEPMVSDSFSAAAGMATGAGLSAAYNAGVPYSEALPGMGTAADEAATGTAKKQTTPYNPAMRWGRYEPPEMTGFVRVPEFESNTIRQYTPQTNIYSPQQNQLPELLPGKKQPTYNAPTNVYSQPPQPIAPQTSVPKPIDTTTRATQNRNITPYGYDPAMRDRSYGEVVNVGQSIAAGEMPQIVTKYVADTFGWTPQDMSETGFVMDENGNYIPDPAADIYFQAALGTTAVGADMYGVRPISAWQAGVEPGRWTRGNRAFRRGARGGGRRNVYRSAISGLYSWRTGGF